MSDELWYIKDSRLFERLPAGALRWLEARARLRRYPPRAPVCLPADAGHGILVVAEGQVQIRRIMPDGRDISVATIDPGELFGQLTVLGPRAEEEYAETTQPSTLVLIPSQVMRELLERNPQLALEVTRRVGLHRRRMERRLEHLLFKSNRERLTHLLLDLAAAHGKRVRGGGLAIAVRWSHRDLARVMGGTRDGVTWLLGKMQQEGLITLERRRITIHSVGELAQSVNALVPQIIGDGPVPQPGAAIRAAR